MKIPPTKSDIQFINTVIKSDILQYIDNPPQESSHINEYIQKLSGYLRFIQYQEILPELYKPLEQHITFCINHHNTNSTALSPHEFNKEEITNDFISTDKIKSDLTNLLGINNYELISE
ncbi:MULTISPECIES: hypothetical protein [spotted fever group]|uniref:Uncharacterized protein n=1 Tax=Rickettsia tamurae subsp. buchneri TaxID=1462938 RepID=A0A8E0WK94_9RICK|nr:MULTISPECIES: hypothetical protein [spotted fever group]EER20743.1 hypothetical protein REIS_2253 [Rickettsia endosymbiont of Ixodes scapularis]KDO02113.1 hypothetical protein REISMN_08650 [Rickettsia tamurae subsp. buchneri]